ncbi:MAG: hypothetical protein IJ419_02300 [Agathobacter sp.]|nr:hypothetical protein [Agathobacter sp.]
MTQLPGKYIPLLKAALNSIRKEIDRCYWNENQKEMVSPFDNTGAPDFTTPYFTARSYSWQEEDIPKPNFETKLIRVYWYKHSNRGVSAVIDSDRTDYAEIIVETLNKSLKSIEKSFQTE